jgi:hypothetical protein
MSGTPASPIVRPEITGERAHKATSATLRSVIFARCEVGGVTHLPCSVLQNTPRLQQVGTASVAVGLRVCSIDGPYGERDYGERDLPGSERS